jgi:D-glycero-beta-D-manno-heptose 1-phosphate adenylyltransferase
MTLQKIYYDLDSLVQDTKKWKSDQYKVVFTNGCFDLIHLGHIRYLEEAKSLGDKLIIGVNSSASVSKLKGHHRPINDEATRLNVLAAFWFVDAVIVFDENTPYHLIEEILPDVLVKGGDWDVKDIVGSDLVVANGGIVKSLAFIDGYSTSKLEAKIIQEYQNRVNEIK